MKKHPTLLPEIKAMLAERKIQREVAEHHDFWDRQAVRKPLERERARQRKLAAEMIPKPQRPAEERRWSKRHFYSHERIQC